MDLYSLCLKNADSYRSMPFWSWNDELETDKLLRQIDFMNKNGIGGFFMHARSGLKTPYLSEKWFECIKVCAEYAEKLGMEAWAYDENGWPSGFAGGLLLDDKENHDRYLTHNIGKFDPKALVSYLIGGNRLIRATEDSGGSYLNVYEHFSSSTADILNPDVTDKFIYHTHCKYKELFGEEFPKKLRGFFTDEPQYYRWSTPYTKMIAKYFSEKLNEDIFDGLGLLFLKKEGYRQFRYKYWKGMQALIVENFGKKIYDWCDKNGVALTGHYIEETSLGLQMLCCAGIMPLYEYEHIPGIDWLGRYCDSPLSPRQVSSVAAQLGKKKVLCEMYAAGGWDYTPRELKILTEYLYLNGINLTCQHLLPYSERGNRIHDYPAHYSEINPWVKKSFKAFNEYFSRLGALLGSSEEETRVAVLQPIRSAYFEYDRSKEESGFGITETDRIFSDTLLRLEENGVNYHIIDETILGKYGKVENGALCCGKCSYEYLIMPGCITMDRSTEKLLRRYSEENGRVLILGGLPKYLEGEPYTYEFLKPNTEWADIFKLRPFEFSSDGGKICLSSRKSADGERFIFILNHSGTESGCAAFNPCDGFSAFEQLDIMTGERQLRPSRFTLAPGESAILIPVLEKAEAEKTPEIVLPFREWTVISSERNSVNLDKLSYSTDGSSFSEPLCCSVAFRQLLCSKYEGKLWLRFPFEVSDIPNYAYIETQMRDITEMKINGENCNVGCDISAALKNGENIIELTAECKQRQEVYDVLFGENVTESLKNCLVYDFEIEPVILKGNFGVYSPNGFNRGDKKATLRAESFFLGAPPKKLTGLVDGGFPFFAGDITLSGKFTADTPDVRLRLPGRWHIAQVKVNGTEFKQLMFSDTIDVSAAAVTGENQLEVTYTIGNRNLYGPHHYKYEDEPYYTSPQTFEFTYNKENSVPDDYAEYYAFVEPLTE